MKRGEFLYTDDRNVFEATTFEHSMKTPHKIRNRTTICSSNFTFGYLSKENEIPTQKEMYRDFRHSPLAGTLHLNAEGLGSTPGQGTGSHMPHLRPSAAK